MSQVWFKFPSFDKYNHCGLFLYLIFLISQDYMAHGSQGLFTQAGYNEPTQDDASQSHFGVVNPNALQTQVFP